MGILGYPNMDDNGQDGSFGDYSDIYSNYSEDEYNETIAPSAMQTGAGANGDVPPQYSNQNSVYEQQAPQARPQNSNEQNKGSFATYLVFMLILCMAAAGTYFYKTKMQEPKNDVQSMGDYFYNNTEQAKQQSDVQNVPVADANMATVDVDLNTENNTQPVNDVATSQAQTVAAGEQDLNKQDAQNVSNSDTKTKKQEDVVEKTAFKSGSVVIPVLPGGRVDPFMPFGSQATISSNEPKFDIIAPPTSLPEVDPIVDKMLDFKVTGIMFDDVRPSAILVVDGYEQLVHKGDVVMDCKVMNITRDKVVVKYKSNIYEVSTGQSLLPQGVNINPVSSLSNKFGGAYTQTPKGVIEIN